MVTVFENFDVNGVIHTENPVTFQLAQNTNVTANYGDEMGTVTFKGTVSGQAAPGRSIVITVTRLAGGTATVNTVTLADLTFTATYTSIAGSYSAKAKALADQGFAEGSSPDVPFTIELLPTAVTLVVT